MRNLLSLVLGILFSSAAFGQGAKLKGTVRDAETGEPIAIAWVVLYQNGVAVTGTETDFDGNYSITEIDPGAYKIEFTTTGYISLKVEKYFLLSGEVRELDVKMEIGIELGCFGIPYLPPLIEQDNTTQGHVFRREDIHHSPIR